MTSVLPDKIIAASPAELPVFKRPRFAAARIRLNELLLLEDAAARLRWAVRNASEPQVCSCGEPATVAKRDGDQTLRIGGPVFYACDRHCRRPLTAPPYAVGERRCVKRCGWVQYADDAGSSTSSGGPTATSDCDHEWSPVVRY